MTAATRKPLLVNLAWSMALALLLSFGYVASYPIALRLVGNDIFVYRPLYCLIDDGPLEGPMSWWAVQCGARVEFLNALFRRMRERERQR